MDNTDAEAVHRSLGYALPLEMYDETHRKRCAELAEEAKSTIWRNISTAPRDQDIIGLTRGGKVVKMRGGRVSDDETIWFAWHACDEDQHPSCWTDGICWSANADRKPSDPPVKWRPLP